MNFRNLYVVCTSSELTENSELTEKFLSLDF